MTHDKVPATVPEPTTYARAGSAAVDAMVARTAPVVLELLADGTPRSRSAIVEALADRHRRMDVAHALIRLAVNGEVIKTGGRYALRASGALESSRG
jgi:hypothetical protein